MQFFYSAYRKQNFSHNYEPEIKMHGFAPPRSGWWRMPLSNVAMHVCLYFALKTAILASSNWCFRTFVALMSHQASFVFVFFRAILTAETTCKC